MKKMILVGTGILVCLVAITPVMAAEAPIGYVEYEIQPHDSLWGISEKILVGAEIKTLVCAIDILRKANGLDNPHLIHPWNYLLIPESAEFFKELIVEKQTLGVLEEKWTVPEKRAGPEIALALEEEIDSLQGENKALREIISNRFIGAPWDRVIAMFKKFPDMSELTQEELESFDITAVVGKFDQYLSEVEKGRWYYFWMVIIFIAGFVIVLTLYLMASGAKFNLQRKIDEIQANKKNSRLIR